MFIAIDSGPTHVGVVIMALSGRLSDVCIDDYVEIRVEVDETSKGTVCAILTQGDRPRVRLVNGDAGYVVRIIKSQDEILRRIMTENQYTENKEIFGEGVMRSEAIPQAVQAFLNSEGGHLYIGVTDTGGLDKRLVGLDRDFEMIQSENRSNDHLCDLLKMEIVDALNKHLSSEVSIGSFVDIEIVRVRNTQIVEIKIRRSPEPWFYHHNSKSGKPVWFQLKAPGKPIQQRVLDDFYIRLGNKKKMLHTHEEFYRYAKTHFGEGR